MSHQKGGYYMEKINLKYFLAANSCQGFVSYFDKSYNVDELWQVYIIKGGPGTGKSSFMKYIAKKANEEGLSAELCPCSSDPHSLDAVIIPQRKTVIMDGTSPHTVDPCYPAVCEEILNFGQFWNSESFKGKEQKIIALTDKNKRQTIKKKDKHEKTLYTHSAHACSIATVGSGSRIRENIQNRKPTQRKP